MSSFVPFGDSTARIRILGCDPPPPPRRRVNWFLVAGCSAMIVAGVGITLSARALHPQIVAQPPAPVVMTGKLDAMGSVNTAAARPTRDIHRAMRAAVTSDLPGAARYAARTEPWPAPVTGGVAGRVSTAPVQVASGSTPSLPTSQSAPAPASPRRVVIGPEQPPGPNSANMTVTGP